MTAMLFALPKQRVLDANAKPVAGARIRLFDAGTTTPKTTYSNRQRTIAHTHPIVADADGWVAPIYPPDGTYKIQVATAADVVIWDADDQQGPVDLSGLVSGGSAPIEPVVYLAVAHASNASDYGKIFFGDAAGGAFDFNAPTAIGKSGQQLTIINGGASNTITVKQFASELLDGGAQIALYPGERVTLVSDGAQLVRKSEAFRGLRWQRSITLATGFDLNTLTDSGRYEVAAPTNGPGTGTWYLDVDRSGAGVNAVLQRAVRQDVDDQAFAVRRRVAGTWGAWRIVRAGASDVRQTVLSGPVDTAGQPTFLSTVSGALSLTTDNISAAAPLIVTAAMGFDGQGRVDRMGRATANLTWTGLPASSTAYLYVDVAADGTLTPGFTTLAPIYQWSGAYSTTSGQYTYNITEALGKAGTGSDATQVVRVYVGEAVTNGTSVTSVVAYAYQGRYETTALTPVIGARASVTHNIGVIPVAPSRLRLKNITTENSYTPGQFSDMVWNSHPGVLAQEDRNVASYTVNAGYAISVNNRISGLLVSITPANWRIWMHIERGW